MRIKTLDLNISDVETLGIKDFFSNKFNHIIALVGKNGSGKSRYLKAIEHKLRNCTIQTDFETLFDFSPETLYHFHKIYLKDRNVIDSYIEFAAAQKKYTKNGADKTLQAKLNDAAIKYNKHNQRNQFNENIFNKRNLSLGSEISKRLKVIKPVDLRALQASFDSKSGKTSFQDIIDSTIEIDINEFEMISESGLTYFKRLPNQLAYDDIDCRGNMTEFENRISYIRYNLLRELVNEFLGKILEWHSKTADVKESDDHVIIKSSGYWTINGREFNYADFSDGEKILFTYAILLFLLSVNSTTNFKESIIIIDEPELNLHPKAQIKLIQTLENLIREKGQLIIATHSLSIIANLDYSSIFLVKDNQLSSPSSAVPFNAIDELMGFEEHYNKIIEFLTSTPAWAMTNFMAQCFEDAQVFETADKSDPQLEIFKNLVQKGSSLNILDFGSGKGRLLEQMKESSEAWNRVQTYDCFDVEESFNERLLLLGASHTFNRLEQIPQENYDVIVVVNVLHEIHIKHWSESLRNLKMALKPNGFLAIIEDTELPIGELPCDIGFLLLGHEELKLLLGKEITFIESNNERYKKRIMCGVIAREKMNTFSNNKLIPILQKLNENSLQSITDYRKIVKEDKKVTTNLGRLYGLKANSYVNSQLALNFLNESKSK